MNFSTFLILACLARSVVADITHVADICAPTYGDADPMSYGPAPDTFTVEFQTNIDAMPPFVMNVTRAWAPLGNHSTIMPLHSLL